MIDHARPNVVAVVAFLIVRCRFTCCEVSHDVAFNNIISHYYVTDPFLDPQKLPSVDNDKFAKAEKSVASGHEDRVRVPLSVAAGRKPEYLKKFYHRRNPTPGGRSLEFQLKNVTKSKTLTNHKESFGRHVSVGSSAEDRQGFSELLPNKTSRRKKTKRGHGRHNGDRRRRRRKKMGKVKRGSGLLNFAENEDGLHVEFPTKSQSYYDIMSDFFDEPKRDVFGFFAENPVQYKDEPSTRLPRFRSRTPSNYAYEKDLYPHPVPGHVYANPAYRRPPHRPNGEREYYDNPNSYYRVEPHTNRGFVSEKFTLREQHAGRHKGRYGDDALSHPNPLDKYHSYEDVEVFERNPKEYHFHKDEKYSYFEPSFVSPWSYPYKERHPEHHGPTPAPVYYAKPERKVPLVPVHKHVYHLDHDFDGYRRLPRTLDSLEDLESIEIQPHVFIDIPKISHELASKDRGGDDQFREWLHEVSPLFAQLPFDRTIERRADDKNYDPKRSQQNVIDGGSSLLWLQGLANNDDMVNEEYTRKRRLTSNPVTLEKIESSASKRIMPHLPPPPQMMEMIDGRRHLSVVSAPKPGSKVLDKSPEMLFNRFPNKYTVSFAGKLTPEYESFDLINRQPGLRSPWA